VDHDVVAGAALGPVYGYPFRMTASNIAKFRNDPNAPFWKNLKEGSDYFETRWPPLKASRAMA
jgi:murein L,D-transpeptidase YafK